MDHLDLRGESAVAAAEQTLGRNIRSLRRDQGHTQVQLAQLANVSLGALKNLESGRGATTRTLIRVSRALEHMGWVDTFAPARHTFNPFDVTPPTYAAKPRQ